MSVTRMVRRSIVIALGHHLLILWLILVLLLVPAIVSADPMWSNGLEIQGAHAVSEGAYFRFWMVNHYPQPLYVTVNDGDLLYILPNASVNYNVIAPMVSFPYEQLTYTFKQYFVYPSELLTLRINFTVLVLNSDYLSYDYDFVILTNTTIAVGLTVVAIAFIIWQRRQQERFKVKSRICPSG